MSKNNEFYVGYLDSVGDKTKRTLKYFVWVSISVIIIVALIFSLTQKHFKNSSFELTSTTEIYGIFHKSPYPMLRVQLAEHTYKNILLLGFGKFSANPFLEKLQSEVNDLNGKKLKIEGNLIYYNGKTLIQITDNQKVTLIDNTPEVLHKETAISEMTLEGEIIDPKCYFGVMKPGKGKIHRSCAVRCISGGIPPVLVTTDNNNIAKYFLLTDIEGNPINREILPYIGKPSKLKGIVSQLEDWYLIKINISDIKALNKKSKIY